LVFLVGPNGSGKSNFLDALRLTSEALRTSLDHALRERGGITEVRRRSSGHPTHFGVRLDVELAENSRGWYAFLVGAEKGGGYVVQEEECRVGNAYYSVKEGSVRKSTEAVNPPPSSDRLYLVTAAGLPAFRPMYDALLSMTFLSAVPDVIRKPQPPDPGELLARDGQNLAGVFERLSRGADGPRQRIEEYLQRVVPGIRSVDVERALGLETLAFRQTVAGRGDAWRFNAISMSDGTLRAFAVLVALFRLANGDRLSPMLVGLEEPETALHPAAAGLLLDALQDASEDRQVLVTTHSPDLLDSQTIATDNLLGVTLHQGQTQIGCVDEAGRSALRDHLYTAGELLRLAQLAPDPEKAQTRQPGLFSED
jgi:predicted ATPase